MSQNLLCAKEGRGTGGGGGGGDADDASLLHYVMSLTVGKKAGFSGADPCCFFVFRVPLLSLLYCCLNPLIVSLARSS